MEARLRARQSKKSLTRTHAYVQDAKPTTQSSKSLEGEWKGTLEAGGQKLRLVIRVTKGTGEKLSGAMDSLDQGARDIPISSVEQSGDQVKLELAGIGAHIRAR